MNRKNYVRVSQRFYASHFSIISSYSVFVIEFIFSIFLLRLFDFWTNLFKTIFELLLVSKKRECGTRKIGILKTIQVNDKSITEMSTMSTNPVWPQPQIPDNFANFLIPYSVSVIIGFYQFSIQGTFFTFLVVFRHFFLQIKSAKHVPENICDQRPLRK